MSSLTFLRFSWLSNLLLISFPTLWESLRHWKRHLQMIIGLTLRVFRTGTIERWCSTNLTNFSRQNASPFLLELWISIPIGWPIVSLRIPKKCRRLNPRPITMKSYRSPKITESIFLREASTNIICSRSKLSHCLLILWIMRRSMARVLLNKIFKMPC